MTVLDIGAIKEELVVFLRNQDILSISERGVTTKEDTGTFVAQITHLINKPNVKNIRSISVGANELTFGTDYTVDYYYDDSGTIKCKITFNTAQTGGYSINYDYGTDKIWPDFPRDDLSISSYPRIGVDIISITTAPFGVGGNTDISNILFSVRVYGDPTSNLNTYMTSIRTAFLTERKNFYNLGFIKPVGVGPLIEDGKRQQILSQNIDFMSMFNVESTG